MKLKRRNLLLLLTAALLTGTAVLTRNSQPSPPSDAEPATDLFDFEEQQVQALTVTMEGRSLAFEKDANGVWQMTQPEKAVANDANLAYLLNVLATGTSDRTLTVASKDLPTYGLDQPYATLDITLSDQQTHSLTLGTYNFNRTRLYALVDAPQTTPDTLEVSLAPADFEVALNRPLEEWKQPPEGSDGAEEAIPEP